MQDIKDVELVLDCHAEVGESPIWDAANKILLWVDSGNCLIGAFDPATGTSKNITIDQHIGAIALREGGGHIVAVRDGYGLLDNFKDMKLIAKVEPDKPGNWMNDGKVDSQGRFWAGTMAAMDYDTRQNDCAVFRMDADQSVHRMIGGTTVSNGIGWSPDDKTMYFSDTIARTVDQFDFDAATGEISNRRTFAEIDESLGLGPDGLTVDSDGCVWLAVWGSSSVRKYKPNGDLAAIVHLPVSQVTSCTFGGDDLGDLYITTAGEEMAAEGPNAEPQAGGIWRCRPGVFGMPSHKFAG